MHIEKEYALFSEEMQRLYLDFRPNLDLQLKFDSWENGFHMYRKAGDKWVRTDDDPGLPFLDASLDETDGNPDVLKFIKPIPKKLQHKLRRFIYYQFSLLKTVLKNDAAVELLDSNPVLLWLMVVNNRKGIISDIEFEQLLHQKQLEIIDRLYGRKRQAYVKFLKKVTSERYNAFDFDNIEFTIQSDAVFQMTLRRQQVSTRQLRLLKHFPDLRNFRLFEEFCWTGDDPDETLILDAAEIRQTIRDSIRLGRSLEITNTEMVVHNCQTFDQLRRLHNRWIQRLNRRWEEEREEREERNRERNKTLLETPFPQPPLEGTAYCVPLRTSDDLYEESSSMEHCVAGYLSDVLEGSSFIYRVLYPERCTLELRMTSSGIRRGQFKLKKNKTPSPESDLLVSDWFERKMLEKGQRSPAKTKGTPIILIGLGDIPIAFIKELDVPRGSTMARAFVGDRSKPSDQPVAASLFGDYWIQLSTAYMQGFPGKDAAVDDQAQVTGFRDLMKAVMGGASQVIVVGLLRKREDLGIALEIADLAKSLGINTTCAAPPEPASSDKQKPRLNWFERRILRKQFDNILIETITHRRRVNARDVLSSLLATMQLSLRNIGRSDKLPGLDDFYSGRKATFCHTVTIENANAFSGNELSARMIELLKLNKKMNRKSRCFIQLFKGALCRQEDFEHILDQIKMAIGDRLLSLDTVTTEDSATCTIRIYCIRTLGRGLKKVFETPWSYLFNRTRYK